MNLDKDPSGGVLPVAQSKEAVVQVGGCHLHFVDGGMIRVKHLVDLESLFQDRAELIFGVRELLAEWALLF